MADHRHRNPDLPVRVRNTDASEIAPRVKHSAVYIKNQMEEIAKEIIFRCPFLLHPQKIPLCL